MSGPVTDENGKPFTGPIAWMAKNPVASNLLMAAILAAGVLGLMRSRQEVFPERQKDEIAINVAYPGASPAEVEQGISLAVEEAIRGLDGIDRVKSTSSEGAADIRAELQLDADPDLVLADIKSAVDRINSFPEDAERPVTRKVVFRSGVMTLYIHADAPLATVHAYAEEARARLLESPDVTQIVVAGVPQLEIAIEVRRERLEALGLSLADVSRVVSRASLELPGGTLKTTGGQLLVKVDERRKTGADFGDLIVKTSPDGGVVRLSDVATITDGYAETDQESYFAGETAVRLNIQRVGDETPTRISKATRAIVADLRAEWPERMHLTTGYDGAETLEARIDLLVRNARSGLVLVLIILALFLELELALWVALGIPISFMGAFSFMPGLDLSINMVTLFAFIITLGMVVDDAIVVAENAYERQQQGMSRTAAAIAGAREMAVPVTFAILTTVAAFSPLFFVPGTIGKIFGLIPWIVVSVLVFSLVESFFVLPAHLAHGKKRTSAVFVIADKLRSAVGGRLESFIETRFDPFLRFTLKMRYPALAGAIASFIVAVGLVVSGNVPFVFFPQIEGDVVTASARLPYGAPLEGTRAVQKELEAAVNAAIDTHGGPKVQRGVFTQLGVGAGRESGSHVVTVTAQLVPSADRTFSSADFEKSWREALPPLAGVEALTFVSASGPGAGSPVNIQLSHRDTAVLAKASDELTDVLRGYTELASIENSYSSGKPQLTFALRPEAQALGLSTTDIARQLRASFFGAEAIREQRGRNEMRVMVRLPKGERRSMYDLEQVKIRTPRGAAVPLGQIVSFTRGRAPTSIVREDGKRIVNVKANTASASASARPVLDALKAETFDKMRAAYPGLSIELVGRQRSQGEAFASLGQNFIFALFAIFALLAIPFRSYIQPFIIMSAIPFGFVGAVAGHMVMGFNLSVISMMGIIALAGVVVNDSLVLLDAINTHRKDTGDALGSIVAGAKRRFRPILLTSLTTFFGLAPMIFETSMQARFLIPMAISLGFGILFATVIALLIVPALYLIVEDIRVLFDVQDPSQRAYEEAQRGAGTANGAGGQHTPVAVASPPE